MASSGDAAVDGAREKMRELDGPLRVQKSGALGERIVIGVGCAVN